MTATDHPARIGILALQTRFPRIAGDVGNPATYGFPVRIEIVAGATPDRVVHGRADGLFEAFADAARRLAGEGCEAIITTCGFLTLMQEDLRRAAGVPTLASALIQTGMVAAMLPPGRRPGIVTASARSLTPAHLVAAGADPATPVSGVAEGGEFARVFLGDAETLDVAAARGDVLAAAGSLLREHADIGAIVLECANMGPYAADVRNETGLPVFDMVSLARWLRDAIAPPRYPAPARGRPSV